MPNIVNEAITVEYERRFGKIVIGTRPDGPPEQ